MLGGDPQVESQEVVHAIIQNGHVEVQEPIPEAWEGQSVKIVPLTPDDPMPDLEARLVALHQLGPVELDPDERARIDDELKTLDEISKQALERIVDRPKP
jgi:hypothetical protein